MAVDPISDMLSRIRNAAIARHDRLLIPHSKIKEEIAKLLSQEGYIRSTKVVNGDGFKNIQVEMKYSDKECAIRSIKRVSKQGRREYRGYRDIQHIYNGLGIALVSTSQGVMTDKQARDSKMGGEILCEIW